MRSKDVGVLGLCLLSASCQQDSAEDVRGVAREELIVGAPMTVDSRLVEMGNGKWKLYCLGRFRNLGAGDTFTYDAFVTFFEEGAQKALIKGQVTPAIPTASRSSLGNVLTVTHPSVEPSGSLYVRMTRAKVDPRRRHSCQVVVKRDGAEVMRGEARPPRQVVKPLGTFTDSGQVLGDHGTFTVALGDLDGDGDLDAFQANYYPDPNRVWLNNGAGGFVDSGQALGIPADASIDVALGDIDSDGDLDAVDAGRNRAWKNNGAGVFTDTGQNLAPGSQAVALGDVDGDGDLDAFFGFIYSPSRLWKNNGSGTFTDSGQALGAHRTEEIALGDLDSDGDLDAFQGNGSLTIAPRVLLNDGSGTFAESGQILPMEQTGAVELGDLDDDGDLDAFLGNYARPNRVLLNNGLGVFTNTGQSLGNNATGDVALGDLDGDGDLDVYEGNLSNQVNRVWMNNGSGMFTDSGQAFANNWSASVALGDLDGDADLDVFEGNNSIGMRVRRNQN